MNYPAASGRGINPKSKKETPQAAGNLPNRDSIACAALPMCGLAFAEAERYLPSLIDRIDRQD